MIKLISAFLVVFSSQIVLAETNPLSQELRTEVKEEKSSERRYTGDVGFTLMGRRYDDAFVNSRWGRAIVELNVEARYQDWLTGRLSASQVMTSGAASYQMGVTEVGPSSGLFLDEATLSVEPVQGLEGTVGVLPVELNPIFTHMFTLANAGGQLSYGQKNETGWGYTKYKFLASQSVPTAMGPGNGSIITDEGTMPLLTVGSVYGEFKNENIGTKFRLSATHFEFTDLATSAAANSLRIGSTIVGTKDFQFKYEYRGKEYALGIKQEIGLSHEVELKGAVISNERAPSNVRDGWQARLAYTRKFDKWELTPSFVQFRVEGDALPDIYATPSVGYTNRVGYGLGLKAEFPKQDFNVFAGYTNAKALVKSGENLNSTPASTYQGDREIFTLGAEVKYDIF